MATRAFRRNPRDGGRIKLFLLITLTNFDFYGSVPLSKLLEFRCAPRNRWIANQRVRANLNKVRLSGFFLVSRESFPIAYRDAREQQCVRFRSRKLQESLGLQNMYKGTSNNSGGTLRRGFGTRASFRRVFDRRGINLIYILLCAPGAFAFLRRTLADRASFPLGMRQRRGCVLTRVINAPRCLQSRFSINRVFTL